MTQFDIAVIGGGLAGSIAAIASAGQGFSVALIAPTGGGDQRTTALMDDSIRFIDQLGLWDSVMPHAAALATMRIIDGTDRLLRAPVASFRSSEIGLDAFGYNIPNAPFLDVLAERIAATPAVTRIDSVVEAFDLQGESPRLTLANGDVIEARLAVGADGKQSPTRHAAGIGVKTVAYPQTALVVNFSHDLPHQNISTEFHTETGPFTAVPLGDLRSSLVWVVRPEQATDLLDMTEEALNRRIEEKMQSLLGKIRIEAKLQAWPLSAMTAERFGSRAVVLVGEAGHAFPPIGAQGLNLSLRDIRDAVDLAVKARAAGRPLAIGEAYDRARRFDVVSRTAGVDLLNRSLLSNFLPVQMLRAAGIHLLASLPPLRHFMMNEGVSPGRALKRLPELLREKVGRQRA
ncbi:2-octaprenyl-6-methoxyphenol hydroxylase [Rhizobium sp. SG_E_25_P2]|uniref:UbiH/UbiF family hydroxylase n=1 Tax=Rhizobium sp. SG_E_25_P2 TaxID=2879942 RepID=UPI002473EA75|nr:UbiH/UbiF family hydroxylase [Rhizobium sp. SG_E_25_P2]MDH6268998.1 2-octaprenyl-6-methoxyphenol hydroxylase [Rhizobium sp. SG_E_25_P2]